MTKPESGPVYFPFSEPGPVRYVRMTWFGSDVNRWSNINEARWSLSGFAGFNGSRMRAAHSNGVSDAAGRTRGRTELSAFDIHLLTELNPSIAFTGHAECYADTSPVLSMVDATGSLDSEMETVDHLGHRLFLVDWNHYTDPGMADEFVGAIPVGFAYYSWLQELNAAGRLGPEQFCDISGLGDYYYAQGTRAWELRTGQTQPNPGVWK